MSDEMFRGKKHVVVLKTTQGDVVVGTDDLAELGGQQWFREFLNIEGEVAQVAQSVPVRQSSPLPIPRPLPRPVPQQVLPRIPSTYLEIAPNDMSLEIWNSLTSEQQAAWMERNNVKQ